MDIKTKLAPGLTGFVLAATAAGIFEIKAVKIKHVEADEDENDPEKIVNTTEDGETYNDNQIFETPEALARDLVTRYNAANPSKDASFALANNGASLPVGGTTTATPKTPGGTFASSDATIATIDGDGLVTAIAPGSVVLSYTLSDGTETKQTLSVVAAN